MNNQQQNFKVCSTGGDERGRDDDRDCPHPIVAQPGNYPVAVSNSISYLPYAICVHDELH